MASIIRRGKSWRAQIARGGKRFSATFDTRVEAEKWAVRTEAAILDGATLTEPVVPSRSQILVSDLFTKYGAQVSPTKGGARWEQIRLNMLVRDHAIFRLPVIEFTAPALSEWRDARLATHSPLTINRELNLVSAVMNTALKEWHVPGLTANPVHAIARPKNPRGRKQRVSPEQRAAIIKHMGWDGETEPQNQSQWAAFAFSLAIETAMRKGEILSITWENVHLDKRHIYLPHTKNGFERFVPLSSSAVALLQKLTPGDRAQKLVKVRSGWLDAVFRKARDAAGYPNVRFHDSRREAATTMSKKLANVLELAAVTGHRSLQVLKGYYEPDPADLADKLG